MPRRLKLSPLQRDIVWTLEEAGAEGIVAMFATVKPPSQAEFDRNVDGLIELGLIRKEERRRSDGSLKTDLILTDLGRKALTQ